MLEKTVSSAFRVYGQGKASFSLATATPGELGLLEALMAKFSNHADARLVWVNAAAGQALALLQAGDVDMAMVHAPTQVETALAEGWAAKAVVIGANEFYLVGPKADPAAVAGAASITEAFQRIGRAGHLFVSRADQSGTHLKEREIWQIAGLQPEGAWYIKAKNFMAAALARAEEQGAYYLCDSSTWIVARENTPRLSVLFRGDEALVNIYHALIAPEGSSAGHAVAGQFFDFVTSPAGQSVIRSFGRERHGEALYLDAAAVRSCELTEKHG